MKKVKCFMREESPYYPGKYIVKPIHENFHLDSTEGSFSVIAARLFGVTYPDYLRMCRDCFGAEIVGKGSIYPVAYFSLSEGLNCLIDQLNSRANLVLWERENPDFEQHAAYVKEKNPKYYTEATGNVDNG